MFKNVLTRSIPSPVTFDTRKIGHMFDLVNLPCSSVHLVNATYRSNDNSIQAINEHGSLSASSSLQNLEQLLLRLFQNVFGSLQVSDRLIKTNHINLGDNDHHRNTKANCNTQVLFTHPD